MDRVQIEKMFKGMTRDQRRDALATSIRNEVSILFDEMTAEEAKSYYER